MKSLQLLAVAVAIVLVTATPSLAATATPGPQSASFAGAGLGAIGAGLTIIGAGWGFGRIGAAALEGMARQPEIAEARRAALEGGMVLHFVLDAGLARGNERRLGIGCGKINEPRLRCFVIVGRNIAEASRRMAAD